MEPQIQYCRTEDGLRIAYFKMGSGPTLIGLPANIAVTIAREMDVPVFRSIAELTSRAFTYVRFDPHGCGLSERNDDDFSVDAFVRDLVAVADAVTPEPFALFANGPMTAPAIAYAAQYPERLTHLILWTVSAYRGDSALPTQEETWAIARTDWRMATELILRAVDNWEHEDIASQLAAMMREAVTPETWIKFEQQARDWDVSEHLAHVVTPTLVMHPRKHQYFTADRAQRVAAEVSGARLALVDSSSMLFPDASVASTVGEFLGTAPPRARVKAAPSPQGGTAVILFADIADSTGLTERMGDAAFRAKARELDDALRDRVRANGGSVIDAKTLGDGILATFPAASQAIAAALSFEEAARASGLSLHVGIHAGDVIREQDNVFGGAVNIAARISALSAPGEVLVSDVVRALARTGAGVTFEDRGEHELKGVSEPQRVFAVHGSEVA